MVPSSYDLDMSSMDDDKVLETETHQDTKSEKQAPPTERDPAPEAEPRPERTASFQDYLVRRLCRSVQTAHVH